MTVISLAILAGVLVPTFVALAVWVAVTVHRLMREVPPAVLPSGMQLPHGPRRDGVRVGAREIRADLRHRERHGRTPAYRFEKDVRTGLPSAWMQDAARRCN